MAKLSELLPGALGAFTEQVQARQEQQQKLQQLFAAALAQERAKQLYPSAEEQAKQQIVGMANQAGTVPQPMGGYNRVEETAGLPMQVQDAAQQRKLAILNYLMPRSAQTANYVINPGNPTQAIPLTTPEGQPVRGRVVGNNPASTTPQTDVQDVVQGIKSGIIPPSPNEISFRDRTRANAELARQGIDLTKLQSDWTGMQAYTKNANSSMQLRMRQALESVRQNIGSLRQLNTEFQRTGWTPANAVELKAALTGTDPTRRDQATRFLTQINVMKDELSQGFMGGGVPTNAAFQLANEILKPVYGSKQLEAAIGQLEANVGVRLNAINSMNPTVLGGQVSPQYQRLLNQPTGQNQTRIRIRRAGKGVGTIEEADFNPSTDQRL